MNKIKLNDTVKIISGKDKNREGKVVKIYPETRKVIVENINMYKKHVKGFNGQKGGIYDLPRPIGISKLMLVCPKCKKPAKVGIRQTETIRYRYCKACESQIDKA